VTSHRLILPEGSTVERTLRSSDMEMMVQFNALEREAIDWEDLIKKADPRLRIFRIHKPARSANSIIEIGLEAKDD
jgi:6-hydroxytryprostatin B O-methyltransferase